MTLNICSRYSVFLHILVALADWIPLEKQQHRGSGYDPTSLGNLRDAPAVERLRVSRNHALVAPLVVGTPPQKFTCLLDSGSADMWIPSKRCLTCTAEASDRNRFFHADQSKTFMPGLVKTPFGLQTYYAPAKVSVEYGSGIVSGYVVKDTVMFGPMVLQNQSFLLAERTELDVTRHKWDGICGFGWKRIAEVGTPVYARMSENGQLPVYTLIPESGPGQPAYLAIGTSLPEKAYVESSLVWNDAQSLTPGHRPSFWVVNGGLAIHLKNPVPVRFLVDTGTTFMLAPSKDFLPFIRSLLPADVFDRLCGVDQRAGNVIVCNCAIKDEGLLPIRVYLGDTMDQQFVLEPDDLFEAMPAGEGQNLCVLRIQQSPMSQSWNPLEGLGASPLALPPGLDPFSDRSGLPGLVPPQSPVQPADPLGILGHGLLPSPGAPGGTGPQATISTKQIIIKTLPNGTLCKSEIIGINGTISEQRSVAIDEDGNELGPGKLYGCSFREFPGSKRRLQIPLQASTNFDDVWILGDTFLRKFVTVFDFEKERVGFAKPARAPVSPTGSLRTSSGAAAENVLGLEASAPIRGISTTASIGAVGIAALVFCMAIALARRTFTWEIHCSETPLRQNGSPDTDAVD